MGKSIIKGHLSPTEAWLALETTIMKSISYPLPALTLTEKQCQFIMAPALKAGLNASHICRSFPRNVLYGSKKEGGFGLPDIYHEQGISHLSLLQQHIDQPSITGNLLRASIEAATVKLGYPTNFFTLPYKTHSKHLTSCWIKHLWKFCSDHSIIVQNHVTPPLLPSRTNDIFIMEQIITYGSFKPKQL